MKSSDLLAVGFNEGEANGCTFIMVLGALLAMAEAEKAGLRIELDPSHGPHLDEIVQEKPVRAGGKTWAER